MERVTILQPNNCKFKDIKHDITHTVESIVDVATYPNGFILTMNQTAGNIEVTSNRPLINRLNYKQYRNKFYMCLGFIELHLPFVLIITAVLAVFSPQLLILTYGCAIFLLLDTFLKC